MSINRIILPGTLIEFIGVSGSGKSTLAQEISRQLTDDGLEVSVLFQENFSSKKERYIYQLLKIRNIISTAITQFKLTILIVHAIQQYVFKSIFIKIGLLKNALFIVSLQERARRKPEVTLIHQGCFQLLLSIAKAARPQNASRLFTTLVPALSPPDLVIVITAECSVISERLNMRSDREKSRPGHIRTDTEITYVIGLLDTLQDTLQNNGVPTIRYQYAHGDKVEDVARALISDITPHLAPQRP